MVQKPFDRKPSDGRRPLIALALALIIAACARADGDLSTEVSTGEPEFGASASPSEPPAKPTCGNSVKDTDETCDDGNALAGDGCSATCTIEPGYKCVTLGASCVAAACGDGIVAGDED